MKTTLYDLYRGPLTVWVEDPLTHSVLTELWGDPAINVVVAEGKPGVVHMVNARPSGYHVYGIVDRDFDTDNEPQWIADDCRVLRLPAHELENLLLDFELLAEVSGAEPAQRIQERAHARAKDMLFWMACCRVLWDLQHALGKGFPTRPPIDLRSLSEAKRHLDESTYWPEHGAAWQRWSQSATRFQALEQAQRDLEAHLARDEWRTSFSGREIFRHLRSYVQGLDRTPRRPPQTTAADRDLNLAKEVARRMRERGRVPSVLLRLREVLRGKSGLTS